MHHYVNLVCAMPVNSFRFVTLRVLVVGAINNNWYVVGYGYFMMMDDG